MNWWPAYVELWYRHLHGSLASRYSEKTGIYRRILLSIVEGVHCTHFLYEDQNGKHLVIHAHIFRMSRGVKRA